MLRRLTLLALMVLPGALLLVAVAWLVRELVVRERRQRWEKRFRSWVTPPAPTLPPPTPPMILG